MINFGKTIAILFVFILLGSSVFAYPSNRNYFKEIFGEKFSADYYNLDLVNAEISGVDSVKTQKVDDSTDDKLIVSSYSGVLVIEDTTFKLQSKLGSNMDNFEFEVYGSNDEKGTLFLRPNEDNVYIGSLKYVEASGEIVIGDIKATIERDLDKLYGKLSGQLQYPNMDKTVSGTISIYELKVYDSNSNKMDKKNDVTVSKSKINPSVKSNAWIDATATAEPYGLAKNVMKVDPSDNAKGFWNKFFALFNKQNNAV